MRNDLTPPIPADYPLGPGWDYVEGREPPPGPVVSPGVYRHHKGGLYRVLQMARHATNDANVLYGWMVIYVSLTGGEVFVRSASEFTESVKWFDAVWRPRFVRIGAGRTSPHRA